MNFDAIEQANGLVQLIKVLADGTVSLRRIETSRGQAVFPDCIQAEVLGMIRQIATVRLDRMVEAIASAQLTRLRTEERDNII